MGYGSTWFSTRGDWLKYKYDIVYGVSFECSECIGKFMNPISTKSWKNKNGSYVSFGGLYCERCVEKLEKEDPDWACGIYAYEI